jgi:hypothetical protein
MINTIEEIITKRVEVSATEAAVCGEGGRGEYKVCIIAEVNN